MLTLDKVYHAAYILRECARKTDLIAAPLLSEEHNLYLKTENLQVTGSFKLIQNFQPDSSLSRYNVVIIIRVNESRSCFLDNLHGPVVSVIVSSPDKFDVCAEPAGTLNLHDWCAVRHTYC